MTEKELMEQEYRKKMEEHLQRMAKLREKRKRERAFHGRSRKEGRPGEGKFCDERRGGCKDGGSSRKAVQL